MMEMFLYGTLMSFIVGTVLFAYLYGFALVGFLFSEGRIFISAMLFILLISIASGFLYTAMEGRDIVKCEYLTKGCAN